MSAEPSGRRKPLRFILVGAANTLIDFGVLFLLTAWGMNLVPANMIATGIALTFSFFVNRSFTFGSSGNPLAQAVKFVIVTLFGLWALQPLVLLAGMALLEEPLGERVALFVSKVAATIVSMVWNYLLYDRFVFREDRDDRSRREDRDDRYRREDRGDHGGAD